VGLLEDPSCPQLKNLCSNLQRDSEDLLVLECIDTFQTSEYDSSIDAACQNAIYKKKTELMNDKYVHSLLHKSCPKELDSMNCLPDSREFSGNYLSCVIDNKDLIKDLICKAQLERIEAFYPKVPQAL
jgi:hypothetical protein